MQHIALLATSYLDSMCVPARLRIAMYGRYVRDVSYWVVWAKSTNGGSLRRVLVDGIRSPIVSVHELIATAGYSGASCAERYQQSSLVGPPLPAIYQYGARPNHFEEQARMLAQPLAKLHFMICNAENQVE